MIDNRSTETFAMLDTRKSTRPMRRVDQGEHQVEDHDQPEVDRVDPVGGTATGAMNGARM